jgi:GT2 family glycosyltransferase
MQPKAPRQHRVWILLLNWNGLTDTRACLRSLTSEVGGGAGAALRGRPSEDAGLLLVDNASTDDSARLLPREFPEVVFLRNRRNLGFAAGNNVGLQYALAHGAEYLWVLNNDTLVAPDTLDVLLAEMEANPEVGMVAPKIYFAEPSDRIWYAGAAARFPQAIAYHEGWNEEDHGQYDTVRSVDVVTGCAALVRAEALRRAGLFDERFFAYYEDVDLSLRCRAAGYDLRYVPQARLWHKVSASTGGDSSPTSLYFIVRNRKLLYDKHGDPRGRKQFEIDYRYESISTARHHLGLGDAARAEAVLSGMLCATLGLYGRRRSLCPRAPAAWGGAQDPLWPTRRLYHGARAAWRLARFGRRLLRRAASG